MWIWELLGRTAGFMIPEPGNAASFVPVSCTGVLAWYFHGQTLPARHRKRSRLSTGPKTPKGRAKALSKLKQNRRRNG